MKIEEKRTDENILIEKTPANLFKGIEAVGGFLKITDQRLIFKSHRINIQGGVTEIPMSDIVSVKKAKSLGFIPNRIIIEMKDGKEYKFVVYKRDKLAELINNQLN